MTLAPGFEETLLEVFQTSRPGLPRGWSLEEIRVENMRARGFYRGPGNRKAMLDLLPPGIETPGVVARSPWATLRVPDPKAPPPRALLRGIQARLTGLQPRFRWDRRVHPMAIPAEGTLPRYSPSQPSMAEALEGARQDLRRGDRQAALDRIGPVLESREADDEALRFAAHLLRMAGEAPRAIPLMEQLLGRSGGHPTPELRVEAVATWEASDLLDPAARASREGAAADPDRFPSPACLRAEALALLNREGVAVADRLPRGPLALDQSRERCVWLLRIHLATRQGDGDAVVQTARSALEAWPDDPDMLYLWGHFFFVRHRLDEALDPWDRLADIEPTYPSLMSLYGTAYLVSGRLNREGIENLLERHRKRPEDTVRAYLAGLGLFYQKEYPRVIPLLTQAAAAVPEDPRPAMYLAMAHFFTGNRDEAIRILEGLERFTWLEPDINYCRSLVYRFTDLPRAIREMETFLRVFEGEERVSFGPQKVQKARSDLERMRRGEVPEVFLPQPDGWDQPVLEVQRRIEAPLPGGNGENH